MHDSIVALVFCRLLGLFVIAPIWGQAEVPALVKGMIILSIACLIAPLITPLAIEPTTIPSWIVLMGKEIAIGFFLGLIGRIILIVLDVVGNIMSFQMGLSFATVMNPAIQTQTTLPSNILIQCGVILMLSLNMHYIFLRGLVQSYATNLLLPESGQHLVSTMQLLFASALRLSMPFLALHVFLQVTMGFLNRFVPTLSFFAISVPIQLWSGLIVMLATIVALLNEFPHIITTMWPH